MRKHAQNKISGRSYNRTEMKENNSFATKNEQADHLTRLMINKSNKKM